MYEKEKNVFMADKDFSFSVTGEGNCTSFPFSLQCLQCLVCCKTAVGKLVHKDSIVGGDYDDDNEEDGDDENRESAEKEYLSFLNPLSQLQNTNI